MLSFLTHTHTEHKGTLGGDGYVNYFDNVVTVSWMYVQVNQIVHIKYL